MFWLHTGNKQYEKYLVNRGYNKKHVERQFKEVQFIPREDLLKPKQNKEKAKKNSAYVRI